MFAAILMEYYIEPEPPVKKNKGGKEFAIFSHISVFSHVRQSLIKIFPFSSLLFSLSLFRTECKFRNNKNLNLRSTFSASQDSST